MPFSEMNGMAAWYVLKLEIVKKLIAFGILMVTMFYGLLAICVGRVLYSIIALYLNTHYTRRLLNYGFITQLREIAPFFAMSLVIMALAMLISALVPRAIVALIVSLVLCPVAYVLMCRIFKIAAFAELMSLIKDKIK